MVQVQLRLADESVREIDRMVKGGKYKNRSDAIRAIIQMYEEREKTRAFYEMLMHESEEARKHPEMLIPLKAVK